MRQHVASLMLVVAPGLACSEDPAARPRPDGLVLEVDGLRFFEHEILRFDDYVETIDRRLGRATRAMGILERHLIPTKLAQRAFPERRRVLRERCEALARAVGNGGYPELVIKGEAVGHHLEVQPDELPLAIAEWAFGAEGRIGLVSPVLETPQGFCLAAVYDIERAWSRVADVAEVFVASFYHHDANEFGAWLEQAEAEIADRVTYVHPDWRDAIPPWLAAR